jgi:hypothetical protein
MRVFIFGSCVSRDAFEFVPNSVEIQGYIARSSFASAFSPKSFPHSIDDLDPDILISSPWQRRMMEMDINKSGKDLILRSAPATDLLIVDFIDERFHLAVAVNAYATVSVAFRAIDPGSRFKYVKSLTSHHFQLWKDGFDSFLELAESLSLNVLVNAVRLGCKSRLKELINDSSFLMLENYLFKMYDYAESTGRCKVLYNPLEPYLDENHKWGVTPFHYENLYYEPLINYVEGCN